MDLIGQSYSRLLPAAKRLRMPAEWAPHDATWLTWPHNRETWPGMLDAVEAAFCEIVAALAPAETVRVNVQDAVHATHVERLLRHRAPSASVVYHTIPSDDAWIRDHGAIFVEDAESPVGMTALDFIFDAWGGKYPPFDRDAEVAAAMAGILEVPVESIPLVLEGGSVDVDGAGTLLTTRQCLLNENRNPQLSQSDIEALLRACFGIDRVVWLGEGIVGDDTDGHVDDITRFVAEGKVVTAIEHDASDPNHVPLSDNRRLLAAAECAGGARLEVIELPMPAPQFSGDQRLPASYANFYVANEVVLMPAFDCANDESAAGVLAECFPGRRVVPIDCRALVAGLGAIHCLTQQVPAIVARRVIP